MARMSGSKAWTAPVPCSAGAGCLDLTQEGAAWGRGPSKEGAEPGPQDGQGRRLRRAGFTVGLGTWVPDVSE